MSLFLASISHETFVKENPWLGGGGYRRISQLRTYLVEGEGASAFNAGTYSYDLVCYLWSRRFEGLDVRCAHVNAEC